jgi:serine/threonine-protein kinase HipA
VAQCAALIRAHSALPAVDLMRFCQWLLFNLFTGNNDNHAKNLSLYQPPGQGVRLTPFYDLMDTRLVPGLSTRFALRIGGEDAPGQITREHLAAMAAEINVKPAFVLGLARSLHTRLAPALQQAISEIEPALDPSGKALAGRLQQHIGGMADQHAARFGGWGFGG